MSIAGELSYVRDPSHDYSAPGTYHLFLETHNNANLLGRLRKGAMTLNECAEAFLSSLGMALQRFSCLRVMEMDIRPNCVEMAVQITDARRILTAVRQDKEEWLLDRRGMTIPLFVGFVKMNSGLRINKLRGKHDVPVWTERYKVRLMTDADEIAQLCERLQASFARTRLQKQKKQKQRKPGSATSGSFASMIAVALGSMPNDQQASMLPPTAAEDGVDTMLLGRALFLPNLFLHSEDVDVAAGVAHRACMGGRAAVPRICSIGPGRIFVTASPIE